MLKYALKTFSGAKFRLISTSFAVILGVGFLAGTFVLTDTIGRTFDNLFGDIYAQTDAVVEGADTVEVDFGPVQRNLIDEGLIDVVLAVDGVAFAEGGVGAYAQMVGNDGKAVGNPGQGAPTLGFDYPQYFELSPFVLTSGTQPVTDPDQVIVDHRTFVSQDWQIGDSFTVLTFSGPSQFVLNGSARFGTEDSPAGATFVLFDKNIAQGLLGTPGKFTQIFVKSDGSISDEALRDRVSAAIDDPTVQVLTGAEVTERDRSDIAEALQFISIFLLVFAGVGVFVGSFIIYNTFSITVSQRTREFAMLRALGAMRRQVTAAVVVEALLIGLFGSIVGIAFGLGISSLLKSMLAAFGLDIPARGVVLLTRTVVVSLVVGMSVTILSSILPALRAARVPPLAAMRDVAYERQEMPLLRVISGFLLGLVGVIALLTGLAGTGGIQLVGLGTVVTLLGVIVLGPVLIGPFVRVVGAPLGRLRGVSGQLARQNAVRSPRRSARTAGALTIGVALVGTILVFASSLKQTINDVVDSSFTGDFVVDSGTFGFGGFSPELAAELNQLPEVAAATGIRFAAVEIEGRSDLAYGVDPDTAGRIVDVGIIEGDLADLGEDGIALLDDQAEKLGVAIGDEVTLRFAESGEKQFEVRVIYTENQLAGNQFFSTVAHEANSITSFDAQIYLLVADGVSADAARTAIQAVTDGYANAELQDLTEFKEANAAQINQLLGLVFALLGVAIVIALFGIANTLALSIFERTREIGLLRAVGMTRSQVRSAVRWESLLIAVFGAVLGLLIGVFFGVSLVRALKDEGITALVVPYGSLIVMVVVAALAGVVASLRPAYRASRLNMLQAISYE